MQQGEQTVSADAGCALEGVLKAVEGGLGLRLPIPVLPSLSVPLSCDMQLCTESNTMMSQAHSPEYSAQGVNWL